MKLVLIFAVAVVLSACGQGEKNGAQIDALGKRVSALEQQQRDLSAQLLQHNLAAQAKSAPITAPHPQEVAAPVMTYELDGDSGGRHQYPTKERCEAAVSAITEGRAARDNANRQAGLNIITSYPVVTCIPI